MTASNPDESVDRTAMGEEPRPRRSPAERVVDGLRFVAFWLAVFLPLAVGGLVLPGLETPAQWRLFVLLATTSVVALYLGHPSLGR